LPLKKINIYIILMILGITSVIPIFLSNSFAAKYEFTNYLLVQLCLFWLLFTFKEDRFKLLLSPSFLAVTYLNLNFLIGSWVFENDLVFRRLLSDYRIWEYASERLLFFNIINLFIICAYFIKIKIKINTSYLIDLNKINQPLLFYVTALVFSITVFVFPYLNLTGFFIVIFKTLLALFLIAYAYRNFSIKKRVLIYFGIIFIFAIFSVQSKREAIFLVLPIFLLESTRYALKLRLKQIFIFFTSGFILCYFILIMSILRNYGGFKADSLTYVDDYIRIDNFTAGLMNNLEISTTYLHSNNLIEYIKRDKVDFVYGETIIKPFFIVIPRSIFKKKPKSSIEIYTAMYDKEFRDEGGSFPISIQSELYLNFGIFSHIFAFIFFVIFNTIYRNTLILITNNEIANYVYLLFGYMIFLALVRGSGLDIFVVYLIVFLVFFILYKLFLKILYAFIKK